MTTKSERARRLMIEAALDYTRLRRKMRAAVRMVLLEGASQSEAARRCGLGVYGRQRVHRAMASVTPKLREIVAHVRRGPL